MWVIYRCCYSEVCIDLLFHRYTWAYIHKNERFPINLVVRIDTSELIPTVRLGSWSAPASYHNNRVLCCAISFIVRVFVLQNTNNITVFHAIVHRSSPLPLWNIHVGSPIAGSQIRPRWHYDACLSRLAPRPHRLHTTNGGVYEPFAVPVARYYPITTVQHPVTGGSSGAFGSQKLTGAPGAASSKRQPQSATNWIQHRVNTAWMVTALMETIVSDLVGRIWPRS